MGGNNVDITVLYGKSAVGVNGIARDASPIPYPSVDEAKARFSGSVLFIVIIGHDVFPVITPYIFLFVYSTARRTRPSGAGLGGLGLGCGFLRDSI